MGSETFFAILAIAAALYMAWNIGANDVANSMATSVGAKAITLRQAVVIAAVLEFSGAFFVGNHVTKTVAVGLIHLEKVPNAQSLMLGALAAVLAAALWITVATWKELPISTTHSIVGAMVGFGLIVGGIRGVVWTTVGKVVLSWIVSPLFGALAAYLVFRLITRLIFARVDPLRSAQKLAPLFIGFTVFIIVTSLLAKTPLGRLVGRQIGVELTLGHAILFGILTGLVVAFLAGLFVFQRLRRGRQPYADVEALFRNLQIMTACYVAFAHGANDVANAVGPVATVWTLFRGGEVGQMVEVPGLLLAIGGVGISLGVATWGYRVIGTVGSKITELTNTRGFSVEISAATTVLIASKLGMPISTTHTVVGAVIGVGMARGIAALNLSVLWNIIVSWLLTVPIAGLSCILIYGLLQWIF
ncbi:MAG TPA: inorganic phosphate transporter [Bacteroidetes bacterium]|nr:inorganic phosphate transporter [Bacteroidota bacterium]